MSFPFISRIEIEHFRNLHGLKADLPASAVIVGENRSGKSNLLYALRLVLDPALPDSARELRPEDFWDGLAKPFGGETISIQIDIKGFDGDADAEAVLADSIINASPMTARLTYLFRPRTTIDDDDAEETTEDDYEHIVYGGDNEAHGVGRDVRRWLVLTVLPAMRDAESQLAGVRRPLLRPLLDRVRPLIDAGTLTEVRDELDAAAARLLEEKPLKELQERINERVRDVVGPHMAVSTKFGFAESNSEQLLRSLRLYLDDGKLRSVTDESLGTTNILYLSLLLQDLDERRAKRATAGTILAIEEPEAHLHPHVQRLLFRYALRRKHSVLVTTHSPHVASVAPLGSLMVLRGKGSGTKRCGQICSTLELDLAEQDVADVERYLDVTRAEMLFAKGIVFVEGIAEEFLVPAFAAFELGRKKMGKSLDDLGITVCSVAGTDFDPYWRVTSEDAWGIPRVVITDGDPSKTKPGALLGLQRGARLLGDDDLVKKAKSGVEQDNADVRKALKVAGIFVGSTTLERELVGTMAAEMKAAFGEIHGAKRKATTRFHTAVDKAASGDANASIEVVTLVDDVIGKGRFAQRLASKITDGHEPPLHMKKALAKIIDLVPHA